MHTYNFVLFVHISAVLAAIAASALNHFAESRMRVAETIGELRQWGAVVGEVSKVFPLALLILVASGAYMVSSAWAWTDGWIDVALGGVVLLFINGEFLSSRGRALKRALGGDPQDPVRAAARQMLHDPLTRSLSYATTALSIGIVFVMVNKPSLLGALAALVVASAVGIALATVRRRGNRLRAPAAPQVESTDEALLRARR